MVEARLETEAKAAVPMAGKSGGVPLQPSRMKLRLRRMAMAPPRWLFPGAVWRTMKKQVL